MKHPQVKKSVLVIRDKARCAAQTAILGILDNRL